MRNWCCVCTKFLCFSCICIHFLPTIIMFLASPSYVSCLRYHRFPFHHRTRLVRTLNWPLLLPLRSLNVDSVLHISIARADPTEIGLICAAMSIAAQGVSTIIARAHLEDGRVSDCPFKNVSREYLGRNIMGHPKEEKRCIPRLLTDRQAPSMSSVVLMCWKLD
jgi:hypothetical protein